MIHPRCRCGMIPTETAVTPMQKTALSKHIIYCPGCDRAVAHRDKETVAQMWSELVEFGDVQRRAGDR